MTNYGTSVGYFRQAKDYLNCIKSDVEEHCGKEAADWQHTVNAKAVKPVLRTIDCKLGG